MPRDIDPWLEDLGLGAYVPLFAEHEIDLAALPHITEEDLEGLGVPLGPRRRIQAAIRELENAPATQDPAPADAEHRQLTVMFCDLVGSTELSGRLDPEDYRELIGAYQSTCSRCIGELEGYVAQYMGDGVLAYFGWPRAHEDDAARAIGAAQAIVGAVLELRLPVDETVAVRIGIATGRVVIGDLVVDGGVQLAAIVGETANRAARIQSAAERGVVAVDDPTRVLASDRYEFASLGKRRLKGIAGQPELFRVLGECRAETRFAATRSEQLTPLIGREEELALMERRWRRARAGEGHIVLIVGEPGIGKSRLARALEDRLGGEDYLRIVLQCSPQHESSALHPVLQQLESAAGFARGDEGAARLDKLERALAGMEDAEIGLIATLLGIDSTGHLPQPQLAPPERKRRTLAALANRAATLAAKAPLLLLLEDAHWIDPTTQELLELLLERVRDLPVLVVITYRPGFQPPWIGEDHATLLALNRLGREQRVQMAVHLLGAAWGDAVGAIVERSDGIPLFIEELSRSLRESSTTEIPTTLQDALESRFDRSPMAREVVQVASAIGRTSSHALLSHVVSLGADDLRAALADLDEAGLFLVRGSAPDASYTFKHALIQDSAYGTLVRSRRAELHRRIAEALQREFPEAAGAEPEVVAHHYTQAGAVDLAIPLWRAAGRRAIAGGANVEAMRHFERALALIDALAESAQQTKTRFDVLMELGPACLLVHGMGSAELGALNERALALAEGIGDPARTFRALFGRWIHAIQAPPMADALQIEVRLKELAEATGDGSHALHAHHAQWTDAFILGRIRESYEHSIAGDRIYDLREHGHHFQVYGGHDPGACALCFGSVSMLLLGRAEQSAAASHRSIQLAESVGHQMSLGAALAWAAVRNLLLGDARAAERFATRAYELSHDQGLAFAAPTEMLAGLCSALVKGSGALDERLLHLHEQGSVAGMEFIRPYQVAWLSRLLARDGRFEEARIVLADAFHRVGSYETHWCTAELHRCEGELLRARGEAFAKAESSFRHALEVARHQEARLFELLVGTSLARALGEQGRTREARGVLEPICAGFSAEVDLPHLRSARSLLEVLR